METLFESDGLTVLHEPRGSSTTWVTFGGGITREGSSRPLGRGLVGAQCANGIFVVPTRNHWYQLPEIWAVLDVIRSRLASRTITYGLSMGGFAALAFAKELRADHVVLAAPQVSIHPDIVPFERRWVPVGVEWQRIDARDGANGHVSIVYDPLFRPDRLQAQLILADQVVRLPHAGHDLLESMRRTGALRDVVCGLVDQDRQQVRRGRALARGGRHTRLVAAGRARGGAARSDRALPLAVAAVECDQSSDLGHHLLADTLWSMGKRDEALQADRRAIAYNPSHGGHWVRCGLRLVEAGRATEARELLANGVLAVPGCPEMWNGLSIALQHLGEHATATSALRHAVQLGPSFTSWHENLRELERRSLHPDAA